MSCSAEKKKIGLDLSVDFLSTNNNSLKKTIIKKEKNNTIKPPKKKKKRCKNCRKKNKRIYMQCKYCNLNFCVSCLNTDIHKCKNIDVMLNKKRSELKEILLSSDSNFSKIDKI